MWISIHSLVNNDEIFKFIFSIWSWLRVAIVLIHNAYCIPMYLLLNLVILKPLKWYNAQWYYQLENRLYNHLLYVVGSWSFGAGINVLECGDDIYKLYDEQVGGQHSGRRSSGQHHSEGCNSEGRNCVERNSEEHNSEGRNADEESADQQSHKPFRVLIVANHQSTGDVPLMMQAFTSRAKYCLLWIMDRVFKMTNFGLVSQIHGDYFLNVKGFKPGQLTRHLLRPENRIKNAIILFPEGGFRYKRVQASNKYASTHGLPSLFHVTWPRFGAFYDILKPEVELTHIIDLTIIYEDLLNPISILDITRGIKKSTVIFHYKIHEIEYINSDSEKDKELINLPIIKQSKEQINDQWLNEQWLKKESFLSSYYQDRSSILSQILYHNKGPYCPDGLGGPSKYSFSNSNDPFKQIVTMKWPKVFMIHCLYLCCWFILFTFYNCIYNLIYY